MWEGEAGEYLSRGIRVMINSPPAANSKPFITVNTHAYAAVKTCTDADRCRQQLRQTHRHDIANILASLKLRTNVESIQRETGTKICRNMD